MEHAAARPVAVRWSSLSFGARTALEEQWRGLAARGLPCGAAVTDVDDRSLASGHNRAYVPSTAAAGLSLPDGIHAFDEAIAALAGEAT